MNYRINIVDQLSFYKKIYIILIQILICINAYLLYLKLFATYPNLTTLILVLIIIPCSTITLMMLFNRIQGIIGEMRISKSLIEIYSYRNQESYAIKWNEVLDSELQFGTDNFNIFRLNFGRPGKFVFDQSNKKVKISIAYNSKSFFLSIKSFIFFKCHYTKNNGASIILNNPLKS